MAPQSFWRTHPSGTALRAALALATLWFAWLQVFLPLHLVAEEHFEGAGGALTLAGGGESPEDDPENHHHPHSTTDHHAQVLALDTAAEFGWSPWSQILLPAQQPPAPAESSTQAPLPQRGGRDPPGALLPTHHPFA